MRLRVSGWNSEPILPIEEFDPDRTFFTELERLGHTIVTEPFGVPVDATICWDDCKSALEEADASAVPISRRVLLLMESRVVRPMQYRAVTLSRYGHIFSPVGGLSEQVAGLREIFVPQRQHLYRPPRLTYAPELGQGSAWSNSAAIIQSNRFSAVAGELYSLRREVLERAQQVGVPVALYGIGWNRGLVHDVKSAIFQVYVALRSGCWPALSGLRRMGLTYPQYSGPIHEKAVALSRHCVSIVIENDLFTVTEKLFDAVRAGTIAVYVGRSLAEAGLPETLAIQVAADAESVLQAVQEVLKLTRVQQLQLFATQTAALEYSMSKVAAKVVFKKLAADISDEITGA